jgi:hypothetical protein
MRLVDWVVLVLAFAVVVASLVLHLWLHWTGKLVD